MAGLDRISNLPQNVTHGIMERLPLRDAARLSILSTKWAENWQTLPAVVLDGNFFRVVLGKKRVEVLEYSNIVSKILLQHHGPIDKFTLHVPDHVVPDVTQWISFLAMNCIKEITLNNYKYSPYLKLPFRLFSCANLTRLKLRRCRFIPPHSFKGFQNLISVNLDDVSFLSDDIFRGFVSSCPLLEKLRLKSCSFDKTPHLVIHAPNLKFLVVSGTFNSIDLNGSQGLLSASISLHYAVDHPAKNGTQNLMKFLVSSCQVEKLCFRRFFVEVNDGIKSWLSNLCSCSKLLVKCGVLEKLPMAFTHVQNLRLTGVGFGKELACAFRLIQSCPNIERLLFSVKFTSEISSEIEAKTVEELDLIFDYSYKYNKLRNISFRSNRGSVVEMKIIEFLLACSPVLETFVLEICEQLHAKAQRMILRKLQKFHKASSNVNFIIFNTSSGYVETSESDTSEFSGSDSYSDSDESNYNSDSE